jgi:hypothetical protein
VDGVVHAIEGIAHKISGTKDDVGRLIEEARDKGVAFRAGFIVMDG